MKEILKIINKYQSLVKEGVAELQNHFQTSELLKGYKDKIIVKSGSLESGIEFEFHGVGCYLTVNGIHVNFDFGPNNRCDGFDLWRLTSFIEDNPNISSIYNNNMDLLAKDFKILEEMNIIYKPDWFPGSSLFYFTEK